jgi:type I restriction enzyme S subunit
LVFTLTGENTEEIAKALAYLGDDEIAAGGDLAVWTGHGCDSKYLAYLMYSPQLISQKAATGNGNIVVHTSIKKLQQLEIPLPPFSVQREIVARLERELAAVEKMKKGFEIIAETAKAEFKAELKEVFEEISRGGAETRRLGDVLDTGAGGTPLKQHRDYYDGGNIPWLRSGEVCKKDITETELFITVSGMENSSAKLFPRDSVVVAMYGATAGQVGILRIESTTNQAVCAIFPSSKHVPEFLYYQLLGMKEEMVSQAQGGAQPNISQIKIKNLRVCLPPLSIQREVVARLDGAKAKAERLEAKAREGVAVCETMRKAILKEAFSPFAEALEDME